MDKINETENYNSHNWLNGECPICLVCGESPISLGHWGDEEWKERKTGWKEPCLGIVTNQMQHKIAVEEILRRNKKEKGGMIQWQS